MKKVWSILVIFMLLLPNITPLLSLNEVFAEETNSELFVVREIEIARSKSKILEIKTTAKDELKSTKITLDNGKFNNVYSDRQLSVPIVEGVTLKDREIKITPEGKWEVLYVELEQSESQEATVKIEGSLENGTVGTVNHKMSPIISQETETSTVENQNSGIETSVEAEEKISEEKVTAESDKVSETSGIKGTETVTVESESKKENRPVIEEVIQPVEASQTFATPVVERNDGLQRDIAIDAIHKTVESGKKALYRMILKTTGAQINYKDAVLKIDLPLSSYASFDASELALKELEIEGIRPVFDLKEKTLIYNFPQLKSGRTYERIIEIDTHNGIIPNGTDMEIVGVLSMSNASSLEDSSIVTIDSSISSSITKEFKKATLSGNEVPPLIGSETEWLIKVNIPKKNLGQMYLQPGSDIVVEDELPAGLTYKEMVDGPAGTKPTSLAGGKIKWVFKAPSIEEQADVRNGGALFNKNLRVILKVENDKKWIDKTLTNKASVGATFIDGIALSPAAKTSNSIKITESVPSTGDIKGTVIVMGHHGPKDGKNGIAPKKQLDANPSVYDDASLAFAHNITSFKYGAAHDLKEFIVDYDIDPNLILKGVKTPGGTWYKGTTNEQVAKEIPIVPTPKYNIVLTYKDLKTNALKTVVKENPEQNVWLFRSDLGLSENQQITKLSFVFTGTIPSQLNSGTSIAYRFDVKKGYTGVVENKVNMRGQSTYNKKTNGYKKDSYFPFNYREEVSQLYTGKTNISGDRHATIIPRPKSIAPVVEVGVNLMQQEGNIVEPGQNKMRMIFKTNKSSIAKVNKPVETVALLPIGVTVNKEPNALFYGNRNNLVDGKYELVSDNYNNSGRQLVKVTWPEERMDIGGNFQAFLNVNIDKNAPSTLLFDVYGFSGDASLKVPTVSGESLTNTVLQTDADDLNGDGKKGDQPRVKSGNSYSMIGKYDIQTEKFVKGPEEDWSKMAKTVPGGNVDYKLHMTNTTGKDLSSMTLIDVLPSVGDLGITDNIARGSHFSLKLNGPILLPTEWQNKVSVYYSEATTPNRDDLMRQTNYPEYTPKLTNPTGSQNPNWKKQSDIKDWSKINSFKIELLPNKTWIKGVNMDVLFSMTAPTQDEVSNRTLLDSKIEPMERAAYNSFAVATDEGQPVEPLRVGVYMNYDIKEPVVEKTVNGSKNPLELKNRDEEFTWEVDYDFGNYSGEWDKVQLSDQLNKVLTIKDVKVVNKKNQDVTANGKLTVDHKTNLVRFDLNKKNSNFSYLANDTYRLIIKSTISKDATDEQLLPFIKKGGVPNQAELILNDKPKPSNEVKVIPPLVKGNLVITKISDELGEEGQTIHLAGAEFEVKTKDGKSVGKLVTNAKGEAKLADLALGSYQLIETKAPSGYKILSKPINFEITEKETNIKLTVKNTKNKTYLPNTGGMGTLVFYAVGGLLMVGSLYMVTTKKKRGVK
ncbi:SpaA isopeptide-forming pilin-related protein [Vagococcus fessus]|uniref:SpaA-like prealbumin fold domain-containing protein n=1 Tax=Vagococcus fessus TaxID=120370 RepID=A0A430A954_9ENTE|nr:SpaA isopeptide-forming pilin-related protein [Vagococcus fessus]RSU03599.1 hypothetical protein CBF31_07775 [Vagococcus fessus]